MTYKRDTVLILLAVIVLSMIVCGCDSKPHLREFYAWEKTPHGEYKQVRKNYFMSEALCKNVVDALNASTTDTKFESWPSDFLPNPRLQELSIWSDGPTDHVAK